MKAILFSALLLFTLSGISQTQYCVVGTGRLVLGVSDVYVHNATYQDSTVDLFHRIHKDTISLADVIFYFAKDGWELVTLNQYIFPYTTNVMLRQGGEYFYLVFRRDD